MEPRLTDALRMVLLLLAIFSSGSSENDRNFKLCGIWHHGNNPLHLHYNLSTGCQEITVSANESSLSVEGQITAQCNQSGVIPLAQSGRGSGGQTDFCLYWEPLLDQLWVQVRGKNHTLCRPAGLQGSCCTDLSHGANGQSGMYGIANATISNDMVSLKTVMTYTFHGDVIHCKNVFCHEAEKGSNQVNMIEETVMRSQAVGSVELPCALSSVVEMKEDFQGYNVILPASKGLPKPPPSIYLPACLMPADRKTAKVVCTFFKNTSLFKEAQSNMEILEDVVGITVENEVINNLREPIRISFHHGAIPTQTHSRKCVSWDTRKDPLNVTWKEDGCLTSQKGTTETECLCNHLTYFTIMVQLEPGPVRHLLALTVITSLGCAVSVISCVALIIFLQRKRRTKEQSIPVHMGLAVSLLFLNLLFFFTGTLANVGGDRLCLWVGAGLHYALLSSFTWMGIEIFHTFWLVYMVFSPAPKPRVWNLIGFGLPAVPVIILAAIGKIYGLREVMPSEDIYSPYRMCWMTNTPEAMLAHYLTNVLALAVLVVSGLAMLFVVYREIRTRDEWKQNRVAFLSIWGLSCLFGTTWGLSFLNFGPLSDVVLFLSCFLNSFQGFFLMVRFYMLGWMRRQEGGTSLGPSSTGSTRQHMLQAQEKN
ncbi:adhesion G-protein coupled receptor G5-like [Polymixia lowei]